MCFVLKPERLFRKQNIVLNSEHSSSKFGNMSSGFSMKRKSPSPPKNIVGRQVAKLRNEMNLSQTELAAACQRQRWDISRETLAKIENGIRWVADFELLLLAKVLKAKVGELFPPDEGKYF